MSVRNQNICIAHTGGKKAQDAAGGKTCAGKGETSTLWKREGYYFFFVGVGDLGRGEKRDGKASERIEGRVKENKTKTTTKKNSAEKHGCEVPCRRDDGGIGEHFRACEPLKLPLPKALPAFSAKLARAYVVCCARNLVLRCMRIFKAAHFFFVGETSVFRLPRFPFWASASCKWMPEKKEKCEGGKGPSRFDSGRRYVLENTGTRTRAPVSIVLF